MVEFYRQTVQYAMYFNANENSKKKDKVDKLLYLKIGNGMVETHVKKRKHDDNCRLVLKENHAVMSSVIIIPHASIHRPRR